MKKTTHETFVEEELDEITVLEEIDDEAYYPLLFAYENNKKSVIYCHDGRVLRGEVTNLSPYDFYIEESGKSGLTLLIATDIERVELDESNIINVNFGIRS